MLHASLPSCSDTILKKLKQGMEKTKSPMGTKENDDKVGIDKSQNEIDRV